MAAAEHARYNKAQHHEHLQKNTDPLLLGPALVGSLAKSLLHLRNKQLSQLRPNSRHILMRFPRVQEQNSANSGKGKPLAIRP